MSALGEAGPLPAIPPRDRHGHKGSFGVVGVVAGCASGGVRMIGAPALVARGAFRAGAGLVKIACPEPVLAHAIALEPSATGLSLPVEPDGSLRPHESAAVVDRLAREADALVFGPGLGAGDAIEQLALRVIKLEETPLVIDADGLNALARVPELAKEWRSRAIMTPHPGEWRRLASGVRASGDPVEPRGREEAAASLAQRLGCVVVLKGSGTVVSDGLRTWTCPAGDTCLATAGTGDVLAGVLGALVAAYAAPPEPAGVPDAIRAKLPRSRARPLDLFDAARLGVLAHARAGERWAATHRAHAGALAREIADFIPPEIERLRAEI
ncbi:MAG: NAD(P)H-hydrate dehydratase [Phycisphaerales bacterium]|nr:MAG: NAD(P)H-hydrate dehydratase [Phycisphaerales bacterium]